MRIDTDLEDRVGRDLAFLFEEHGATVRSNTVQGFGNCEVIVAVGNVEFRFEKNQRDGEFRVAVGPRCGHGIWELLHVALAASTGEDATALTCPISYTEDPSKLSYTGLTRLAALLRPRFELLNSAFAPDNYRATHSRMVEIERLVHPR